MSGQISDEHYHNRVVLAADLARILWSAGWEADVELSDATWTQAMMARKKEQRRSREEIEKASLPSAETRMLALRILEERWDATHPKKKEY